MKIRPVVTELFYANGKAGPTRQMLQSQQSLSAILQTLLKMAKYWVDIRITEVVY